MIDPNLLLSNIRDAIGLGHAAIAQVSFAALDEQLSNGGELPNAWASKIAAIQEMHAVALDVDDESDYYNCDVCIECGQQWPCNTIRELEASD